MRRTHLFEVIKEIDDDHVKALMLEHQDVFYILMGKHLPNNPFQSMTKIWLVSSHYISEMYRRLISERLA